MLLILAGNGRRPESRLPSLPPVNRSIRSVGSSSCAASGLGCVFLVPRLKSDRSPGILSKYGPREQLVEVSCRRRKAK